jgi:hypothetical protein
LQFESILLSIQDFISWESLEGGPFHKIEDISPYGQKISQLTRTDYYFNNNLRKMVVKEILKNNNLKKLKPCFKLVKKNNRAEYIVDYKMFYRTTLSFFEKNQIKEFSEKENEEVRIYNPSKNEFYRSSVEGFGNSWDGLKDKARKMLYPSHVVYMNGKYHRPALIKESEMPNVLEGNMESINPVVLTRVAKTILHKLTTSLIENEQ